MLNRILKAQGRISLSALFRNQAFRRRSIFHLKQNYYNELEVGLQLGGGLHCPIVHPSACFSLSEIFFQGEYQPVFDECPLPERWMDLGCHYGFFSLYVAWLRAKELRISPFHALLVDADSRVQAGVESLIKINHWEDQVAFIHGAIAEGAGAAGFQEQDIMSSSLADLQEGAPISSSKRVPIVDEQIILKNLPPPYDLVKIDVEGGEYDFMIAYPQVLALTRYLVMEWHSWHKGGGSEKQIRWLAESHGFKLKKVIQQPKLCFSDNDSQVGVLLFEKI